ncbi:unnamed protein product [Sphagnum jensenii]|uniref:HTH CENPB-type domain-containing protein n=1 Tax=Sphagnum jensenii TaxID=128206 RepID=A0ABP1BXN5_9BRYO
MSKKLTGKRLNESQRCKIISKLSKTNPPSKRTLAHEYDVIESAIRKVWEKRDSILERSALLSEKAKQKTFRASVGRFTELDDMLYIWIDSMHRAKLPVPQSLAILLLHYPFSIQTLRLHGNGLVVSGQVEVYRKCFFMEKELRLTKMTQNYYQH